MAARISKSCAFAHIKRTQGKRSGLEVQVASQLDRDARGYKYEREIGVIEYQQNRSRKYLPDFELPNGIIIETKGWFKTEDRQKHLAIKYQHPTRDIRFVFSNPNAKIGKKSLTTYAAWCRKNGFLYAKLVVPQAWIDEPPRKEP